MAEAKYPSNSMKSKELEEQPKLEKVISGTAKKKSKSIFSELKSMIIPSDPKSVAEYVVSNYIVPKGKELLLDTVQTIIYGVGNEPIRSSGARRSNINASRVSYYKYYEDQPSRKAETRPIKAENLAYSFDDIVLDSRSDAEEVMARMREIVDRYGLISVAGLYDLVGISKNYTDVKYGWVDISNATIVRVRDGWAIHMPNALPLD